MKSRGLKDTKRKRDVYVQARDSISHALDKLPAAALKKGKAKLILRMLNRIGQNSEFMPSLGPVKSKIIRDVIQKSSPNNLLEIGTLFGYSAVLFARLVPKGCKIITLEQSKENAKLASRVVRMAGFSGKITIKRGNALEILPKLRGTFDIVFIDARKDQYLDYLRLIEKRIPVGGIVIADNVGVFKENVSEYLKYVKHSGKYSSKTVDTKFEFSDKIYDAIEISRKMR
ncbi:MAG: class I SAM-dependent methyltransferase [Candidatus Micrarchaeota archaeon]|nr:class I SAM-dependent methyltransferase [Candidatus Micrarchaeota archaeon]